MRRPTAVLASLLAVVAATAFTWPTDHGDARRTGWLPTQSRYRALTTAFGVTLDGAVYGSPIVLDSRLVVATENDTVYSLDAGTGAVRWRNHLRTPVPRSALPCGNIDPLGITGSPVYDAATNRIFVMTESADPSTGVRHDIYGLDATTGAVRMTRRVEVPGTDPRAQQQRGALATDGRGNVFVPFGGLAGDCGNYRGAVVSLKANGALGATAYVVPTGREAGIWAPGGPVVAADGSVYVAVGNGASTSGAYDYSDSVTRLSASMSRLDWFAPSTWASDNAADLDLGSLTPAFTANGFVLQAGKSGTGYVLRQTALGHVGGQVSGGPLCAAYGVAAVTGSSVYLPCTSGVTRVEVHSDGTFAKAWTQAAVTGSPVAGNGALYALGNGRVYALNGATGAVLSSLAIGTMTRFATPALAPNYLYAPTTTGVVAVRIS